jgi:hypothetical protein
MLHFNDLPDHEKIAASAYKTARDGNAVGSLCFIMNRELASGMLREELDQEFIEQIDRLDSIFTKSKCDDSIVLYRGVSNIHSFHPIDFERRFKSLSYWSTSRIPAVATKFAADKMTPGVLLELRIPANTPAFDMETVEGAGGSEAEILLCRNLVWNFSAFRIAEQSEHHPCYDQAKHGVMKVITLQCQ